MRKHVYSNQPIKTLKNYLVCKRVSNKWQVVTSHNVYEVAEVSRDTRATNDLIEGLITDPLFYKIFYKDNVEIKELSNA